MAEMLVDPYTWILVLAIVVLSVVFGRLRHEPAWAIAANGIGAAALLIGMRWATGVSTEAFFAAALATGGFALWVEATRRVEARRVAPESTPDPGDAAC